MDILITTFCWITLAVFVLCVTAFCVGAMSVFFTLGRKFIGDALSVLSASVLCYALV